MRLIALLGIFVCAMDARKFYPDDPIERTPPPLHVEIAKSRKLSDIYDIFWHVLSTPGEKHTVERKVPAQDVNTMGEVVDQAWYVKRHAKQRLSPEQLAAGPGDTAPPAEGPWMVVSAKTEGITPGFLVQDSAGNRYFLKFDPPGFPELATSADVLVSKLFHALGYHVPENYIAYFDRSRLQLKEGSKFRDLHGKLRDLTWKDLNEILLKAPVGHDGLLRASASKLVPGQVLGPFRFFGTRSDDPNDVVPHEHRRMLRGLHVFSAWVGHDDSRAINTLDSLVEEDGLRYIRHYLIDFGSTLGSASNAPNSPRSGFERLFDWPTAMKGFFSFGLHVPKWALVDFPDNPSVGRFSADRFNPREWTPEYPNPAFQNRLPEDTLWAAEQVMAFTDDDIRTIVRTGQYTDPEAGRMIADTLIQRRDAIGEAYLSEPLTLTNFQLRNRAVTFEDLAARYKYVSTPPVYRMQWSVFDNETEQKTLIPDAKSLQLPASEAEHLALDVTAEGNESRRVTIYVRRASGDPQIIGIDRVF